MFYHKYKFLLAAALGIAIFISILAIIAALPSTKYFWQLLGPRFATNTQYQVQSLFLPDQRRTLNNLVVGDSSFQHKIDEIIGGKEEVSTLVINGYDSNDVNMVIRAIQTGEGLTHTRICRVIIQISPNFAVRAKAQGTRPNTKLIAYTGFSGNFFKEAAQTFDILKSWAKVRPDGDGLNHDPLRVTRHVGQTRSVDPNNENWEIAFARLERIKGAVIGILDTRGTDWGESDKLEAATLDLMQNLETNTDKFSIATFETLAKKIAPECAL